MRRTAFVLLCLALSASAKVLADEVPRISALASVVGESKAGQGDPRRHGVPQDAAPPGEARTNAAGRVHLTGDYLGRADPRPRRSLWRLVEVEHGGETRSDVILRLAFNERWAAGEREAAIHPLAWETLRIRGG